MEARQLHSLVHGDALLEDYRTGGTAHPPGRPQQSGFRRTLVLPRKTSSSGALREAEAFRRVLQHKIVQVEACDERGGLAVDPGAAARCRSR